MPASEEFYRDQKRLHLIFLLSVVALLGATMWMLVQDHFLEWKTYARQFAEVIEDQRTQELLQEQQKIDQRKQRDLQDRLDKAQQDIGKQAARIAEINRALDKHNLDMLRLDVDIKGKNAFKAELMSKYDLTFKEGGGAKELKAIQDQIAKLQLELDRLKQDWETIDQRAKTDKAELDKIQRTREELVKARDAAEGDLKKLERSVVSAHFGTAQELRALPVLDAFASPLRVKQVALPTLPLDYNLIKTVTRYDRCQSCHLGIDQPGLEKGSVKQPFCSHPNMDLYVGPKSPHPVEKFGCTICHQGQGMATSFKWASHTPANIAQGEEWKKDHGWFYNEFHKQPMLPNRFVESSCLKCHHDVYQIPEAKTAVLGYKTVQTFGCYGCHEINGFTEDGASIGPNLRLAAANDTPQARAKTLRKVGPALTKLNSKLSESFVQNWIRNPRAFRDSTRMPAFYDHVDQEFYASQGPPREFAEPDQKEDTIHRLGDLADVEIVAMTKFLFHASDRYGYLIEQQGNTIQVSQAMTTALSGSWTPATLGLVYPHATQDAMSPRFVKGNAAEGKNLFATKGCVACHTHAQFTKPDSKTDKFPAIKAAEFGPDLTNLAIKLGNNDKQRVWLVQWLLNPAAYHPNTNMPNLQLTDVQARDLATYLLAVPAEPWEKEFKLNEKVLRDLTLMFERKTDSFEKARAKVDGMTTDQKLLHLGEKTISRLGCFGCHDILGYDKMKLIGVPLHDWGRKDAHKLAFENIHNYLEEKIHHLDELPEPARKKDFFNFYKENNYYLWAIEEHFREGFLMQKLREPRSYDYKRIVRWEDRTRMPRFNLTDEEREAATTFVLGLVGEEVNRKFVYTPPPAKQAAIAGKRLLEQYNCVACHVLDPAEYKFTPKPEEADDLIARAQDELRRNYSFAGHAAFDVPANKLNHGTHLTVRGLPYGQGPTDESGMPQETVVLWEATSLKGKVIPSSMALLVPKTKENMNAHPYGGDYALWLVDYMLSQGTATDKGQRDKIWSRVPPPLIREGEKVQTPWLYRFLRDPTMIRPATVLRMPRFNYLHDDVETLANYFAAKDKVVYPYEKLAERESGYLNQVRVHPNYFAKGLQLITHDQLCVKCHTVGGYVTKQKEEEQGPNLAMAFQRLRPDYLTRWITYPQRLVPYTGMPRNFEKEKVNADAAKILPGNSMDHIQVTRDVLVNYDQVLEETLRGIRPPLKPTAQAQPAQGDGK